MSLNEVEIATSLADAEIIGYDRVGAELKVRVKTWNERILNVRFSEVLLVFDLMSGDVSGFYFHTSDTELVQKALNYAYDAPPNHHSFKHFVFLNIDGEPCLEIVSTQVDVVFE